MVKNEPEKYRFVGHKKLVIAEDENSMETVTARQSKIQDFFELLSLEQAA